MWRVSRPRVVRDRALWDRVEVEYWLDTLAHVQPPSFDDWLEINGHRVAPYTLGWSLLELLRPLQRSGAREEKKPATVAGFV